MLNARRALLAAVLACWCPGAFATGAPTVVIDGEKTTSAQVAVGAAVEVRLRATLGAGFSWTLVSKHDPLAFQGERDEPLPSGKPGATGGEDLQIFSFRAEAPGTANLVFHYRRPWLTNKPPSDTKRIVITVVR